MRLVVRKNVKHLERNRKVVAKDRIILLIDGSTEVCSVAVASEQRGILSAVFEPEKSKQSERLAPMVHEVLEQAATSMSEGLALDGAIVAEGPGSYTGLRIVAGYAKGFCMSRGIPLYTVSTTELMAQTFLSRKDDVCPDALLMPMIDARRMEVYSALYRADVSPLTEIEALVLNDEQVQGRIAQALGDKVGYFFGSGAEKAIELFHGLCPRMEFVAGLQPDVAALGKRGFELLNQGEKKDVTYWEPFYLKEYEAKIGVPNKVLRGLGGKD